VLSCSCTIVNTTTPVTSEPIDQIIVRDYLVLKAFLPTALITILTVTVIVIMGVVVCVKYGKRFHRYEIPMDSVRPPSPNLTKIVDSSALHTYITPSEL